LPRFSAYVMECYLDDLRDMKKQVYGSLQGRADLLPAVEEGMTKEQHRELVRKLLRAMIDAGFSPLSYFDR
jgi:acyl-CoA oxidase